ncbi:MAG: type II secretion system GspH family protein [Rhodospirillales bacterium]|nr:type II secretion system GspH family protein [Rhodospirillales bacterium]
MPREPRHLAFTLIELLVAIGIIALLIALLFPAIAMIRRGSQSSACLSNLRQIGTYLNAYLVDYDGVMPTLTNREFREQKVAVIDNTLVRPGEATEVFRCPADEKELYETSGTSYFWNFTVNGQKAVNLFSIVGGSQPERIPLVSDKEGFHADLRDRINILYADGHAENEIDFSVSLP